MLRPGAPEQGSFPAPVYPKPRRVWPVVLGGLVVAVLGLCALGAYALGSLPANDATSVSDPTTHAASPRTAPHPGVRPAIKGDDLVHVGEDVSAGTYRTATAVQPGGLCYWQKSTDAEGAHITKNDVPTGGRPQVTLVKGEWFKTQGCPDWLKK
jgi:hypothetical protein